MTAADPLMSLPLDQLVTLYRMQAEACTETSFPLPGYELVFEAQEKLGLEFKRRGKEAQLHLLDFLDRKDEWIRYFAAIDAYEIEPVRCHKALVGLIEEMAISSGWAEGFLLDIDPTFHVQLRALYRAQKASPPPISPATQQIIDRVRSTLDQMRSEDAKPHQ